LLILNNTQGARFVKRFIISAFLVVYSSSAQAWETDNSLAWGISLNDSVNLVNGHFNDKINQELARSNHLPGSVKKCESHILGMGLALLGGISKNTHDYVRKNPQIDQVPVFGTSMKDYVRQSIYGDSSTPKELSTVFNVNGIYIGADKLAHAFGMGFIQYLSFRSNLKKLLKKYPSEQAEALAWEKMFEGSIASEKGFCGLSNSGVFSYADTEANYQGVRFYQSLCHGDSPRLQPKVSADGKTNWELARPLDLREYVNPWWDETAFPNAYSQQQWKTVKPRLNERCGSFKTQQMSLQRAYYSKFTQESDNVRYMKQRIEQGKSPDTRESSAVAVCGVL
jgi:hypothetical protein